MLVRLQFKQNRIAKRMRAAYTGGIASLQLSQTPCSSCPDSWETTNLPEMLCCAKTPASTAQPTVQTLLLLARRQHIHAAGQESRVLMPHCPSERQQAAVYGCSTSARGIQTYLGYIGKQDVFLTCQPHGAVAILLRDACKLMEILSKEAARRHARAHPVQARLLLLVHANHVASLPYIIILHLNSSRVSLLTDTCSHRKSQGSARAAV